MPSLAAGYQHLKQIIADHERQDRHAATEAATRESYNFIPGESGTNKNITPPQQEEEEAPVTYPPKSWRDYRITEPLEVIMQSMRGGMQVHAVPENERAWDPLTGKQLPWAFESADPESNTRRPPQEKGPFGKSTRRRGFSRSKTATPAKREDQVRLDNFRAIDDIFTAHKENLRQQEAVRNQQVLQLADANALQNAPLVQASADPTEVILYGFPTELQYAAIDFYERVSRGMIYEDYDRHPPHTKYDLSLSLNRAAAHNLSQTALRKRNTYAGGDHWIKVTFDSAEAADQAIYNSPHNIQGYLVYAEPFRGGGPAEDIAIPASREQGLRSATISPAGSRSTRTVTSGTANEHSPTASDTASSATAAGPAAQDLDDPFVSPILPQPPGGLSLTQRRPTDTAITTAKPPAERPPLTIRGAKRAVLLPAEQALVPATSRWHQWPLVGLFLGGSDIIGGHVSRKEDGSFDWERASFYWRFWAWVDGVLGTDFCGIKID